MQKTIQDFLLDLGILPNLKGFQHLVRLIELYITAMQASQALPKMGDLYQAVAVMENTTPPRVERGARHAIERMFACADMDTIRSMLRAPTDIVKGKFTNREFVALAALHLHRVLTEGQNG